MLIKEIHVKNPFVKGPMIYESIEAEDSKDFEGFIKVKFLKDCRGFFAGDVVLFNRRIVEEFIL